MADLALNNGIKSPVYKSFSIKENQIKVNFYPEKKLRPENDLKGFEIAGNDQIFYLAEANIVGKSVVISSPKVPKPQAARYGWLGDDSKINLFTEDGLPVSPFRTDNFKTVTKDNQYQISFK